MALDDMAAAKDIRKKYDFSLTPTQKEAIERLTTCNELQTSVPETANITIFETTLRDNIRVLKTTLTANETTLCDNRLKTSISNHINCKYNSSPFSAPVRKNDRFYKLSFAPFQRSK